MNRRLAKKKQELKMDLSALFKRAGQAAAKNSPAILTAIGVTGTLTTAYLAAKAGFASVEVLREAEETKKAEFLGKSVETIEESPEVEGVQVMNPEALTTQEKFEAVWQLYIPVAASAALTVIAIIAGNRIGERRTAALASAYSVAEKTLTEYRAKVTEKMGKTKEQAVRDEMAQERVDRNPVGKAPLFVTDKGSVMCLDTFSGRYFTSDVELVRKTVNDINALVINDNYASLTSYWEELGLERTATSDDLGWNTDKLLDVDYNWATWDGQPLLVLNFRVMPQPRYYNSSY